jgi:hypothetical protein
MPESSEFDQEGLDRSVQAEDAFREVIADLVQSWAEESGGGTTETLFHPILAAGMMTLIGLAADWGVGGETPEEIAQALSAPIAEGVRDHLGDRQVGWALKE